jgi:HK97 family phage prohead protease
MTNAMKFKRADPQHATKDFALQIKGEVGSDGSFEGYGSIFGNVDSYGEKVMPGAFGESLARHKREGTKPLMLWQHDSWSPIGVWEDLAEDGKGLWGKGRLLPGVKAADEALILLKAGAVQGLSIGYREVETEPDGNIRLLKKLDLLEISIVSFPANRRARVETVKSILDAGKLPTVREFEEFLRDAGFSKALATAIAAKATPHLRGEPEAQANEALRFLTALRA